MVSALNGAEKEQLRGAHPQLRRNNQTVRRARRGMGTITDPPLNEAQPSPQRLKQIKQYIPLAWNRNAEKISLSISMECITAPH